MWSLNIQLEKESKHYSSGEAVRGKVIFKSNRPPNPGQEGDPLKIEISLAGQTRMRTTPSKFAPQVKPEEYRKIFASGGCYKLFTESIHLIPETVRFNGNNEYEFSILFPNVCAQATDQALPPSLSRMQAPKSGPWCFCIEYKLSATISQGPATRAIVKEEDLKFSPTIEALSRVQRDTLETGYGNPKQRILAVKSLLLDPTHDNRRLGLKEKAWLVIQHQPVPEYRFRLDISHPSFIVLGSTFGCGIKVESFLDSSTIPIRPKAIIAYASVGLTASTHAEAPGALSRIEADQFTIVYQFHISGKPPFEAENGWEYRLRSPRPIQAVLPTFMTFNIRRTYTIKSEVMVEICGKMFELSKRTPVIVMPAPTIESDPPPTIDDAQEEALPAYEDVI